MLDASWGTLNVNIKTQHTTTNHKNYIDYTHKKNSGIKHAGRFFGDLKLKHKYQNKNKKIKNTNNSKNKLHTFASFPQNPKLVLGGHR